MANTVNYASQWNPELVEIMRQNTLCAPFITTNVRWLDAKTFHFTSMQTSGFKNHDRNGGWNRGEFTQTDHPYTVSHDRDIEFLVDKADVDESNATASIQNIAKVFTQNQSGPEKDALFFSKVAATPNAAKDLEKAQNTLGIDELNVVNQDDQSADNSGGGSAGEAGSEILPNYDFEGRFQGLETLLQRVKQLIADIGKLFAPSIKAWGDAFASLKDTAATVWAVMKQSALDLWQNGLAPLGSYILQQFIPSIVNGFSQTFAPIVADVGSAFLNGFALFVQTGCQIISQSINDLVLPLLQYLQTVFLDMLNGIAQAWAQYGQPIMDQMSKAFQNLSDLVISVYDGMIKPILDTFMVQLDSLWSEHIKPLWDNLTEFFGAFGEMVLVVWNEYLYPWIQNMTDVLAPIISGVFKIMINTISTWLGVISDVVSAAITIFKGLCQFISGVFTGNWSKAWGGVKAIFSGVWDGIKAILKGAVNGVISLINSMLQAVESGLNSVIAKLNTLNFDVPDWVPGLGGKSFGFDIPSVSVPKIPMLANGGVITQPTLAMVDSARNAQGTMVGRVIGRSLDKQEMAWSMISCELWWEMNRWFEDNHFTFYCHYFNFNTGKWLTRLMYISDVTCSPDLIATSNGEPAFLRDASVNVIDCGVI